MSSPEQVTTTPAGQQDGAGALAQQVLSAPELGAGYFYPRVPTSTPLGLAAFGLNLALLSIINMQWVDSSTLSFVVPVFFSFGFVALVLAGMWDFRANNGFGGVWQVSYGTFWLSIALLLGVFLPGILESAGSAAAFGDVFGTYLLLWGLYTLVLTVGSYFIARPAFLTFLLLAVAFFLLAIGNYFSPGNVSTDLIKAGGYVGIVDAALAWYVAAALIWNTMSGRQMLPLWPYTARS